MPSSLLLSITKQCGGTPVSFSLVLFNLEQKRKRYFGIFHFVVLRYYMMPQFIQFTMDWYYSLMIIITRDHLVTGYRVVIIIKDDDKFIFIILIFRIHRPILFWNYFLSNLLWIQPLKGSFPSIWVCCTRWSWWLYHYIILYIAMVNNKKAILLVVFAGYL